VGRAAVLGHHRRLRGPSDRGRCRSSARRGAADAASAAGGHELRRDHADRDLHGRNTTALAALRRDGRGDQAPRDATSAGDSVHAVANAAYERLLQARSDPAFTLVPPGPQQDPANQLPRFRHSRTFTEDVGFPLLELYTGEAHDAEFAVRFMQAIERARAARAAGATAIETKQITRAVDLAFQLSEALGFLTNGRKHLPPEWGNALLPEPPLTPAAVTRFRRLVPTIAARLRALGYPPDLVQVAVSELTAPPATAIRGPLFAPFDNLTYRRQEIHVQEVVNGFAQRGRF
jgi:hypothetical protein